MKRLLTSLPLTIILIGCGAPSTQDVAANSSTASASTTTTSATNTTADSTTKDAQATDTKADGAQNNGGGTYKVVDAAQPGVPEEAVAALKKVAVPPPPADTKTPDKASVRLQTSKGPITVELDGKAAPLHVKSFLYLAQRGFYNGTVFHRYVAGFVIQGGDPLSKDPKTQKYAGVGGPGYQVPREYNSLKHDALVLAMARSNDPDSAGSQFYFTLAPAHFLDEGYTVFGKVVEGGDNVLKLRKGDQLKSATVLK